jgi:hypothetical protein
VGRTGWGLCSLLAIDIGSDRVSSYALRKLVMDDFRKILKTLR